MNTFEKRRHESGSEGDCGYNFIKLDAGMTEVYIHSTLEIYLPLRFILYSDFKAISLRRTTPYRPSSATQ